MYIYLKNKCKRGETDDIGGTTEKTLDKIDEILDNYGY